MTSIYLKDIGARKEQQDAVAIFEENQQTFMVLADGMGGHEGGALASSKLIEVAEREFYTHNTIPSPYDFFTKIIEETQKELSSLYSNTKVDPHTTAVFALIQNRTLYYSYLGDSRLYLFEKSKKLLFRTRDDSLPELLYQSGQIEEEEIANHSQQNVLTKSIGITSSDKASFGTIPLPNHQEFKILLASDGLWAMFTDDEVYTELFHQRNLDLTAKKLLQTAKARGGEDADNISLAILIIQAQKINFKFFLYLIPLLLLVIMFFYSDYSYSGDTNTTIVYDQNEINVTELNNDELNITFVDWTSG